MTHKEMLLTVFKEADVTIIDDNNLTEDFSIYSEASSLYVYFCFRDNGTLCCIEVSE